MLYALLDNTPQNRTIRESLVKCLHTVQTHEKIYAAVSGGADSDVMVDLLIRCGAKEKTTFAFPLCVREHGVPFWSKRVSEYIMRLQKHNFQWEDEPLDVLLKRYPRCKAALRWWCNDWTRENGEPGPLCIDWVKGLKEFMIAHPPQFKISSECCHYAKKVPAEKYMELGDFDLACVGVRKAEGGFRATAYSNCFTKMETGADKYRPMFWFSNADKAEYDEHYGIEHSDCYRVWGMKRTGCAGCPFGKDFENELALAEKYEPKFHKAMLSVFGPSYEYTRQFLEFRKGGEGKIAHTDAKQKRLHDLFADLRYLKQKELTYEYKDPVMQANHMIGLQEQIAKIEEQIEREMDDG